jgi:phosphatidylglycerophosphate synthase
MYWGALGAPHELTMAGGKVYFTAEANKVIGCHRRARGRVGRARVREGCQAESRRDVMNSPNAVVVATHVVCLAAVVGVSLIASAESLVTALYPLKTTTCFAIVSLPAIRFARGHPLGTFGPANQVTTLRAAIVVLVVGLIGEPTRPSLAASAAAASLVVTLLDGVDGWLARRTRMASDFGARFDMEVDALLILTLAILCWLYGKAGAWVLLSGVLRYLFVAAGWLWPWLQKPLPPSMRRKAICVVQIVGLIVAIVPSVPASVSAPLAAVALAALGYSFLVDILWLWRPAATPR